MPARAARPRSGARSPTPATPPSPRVQTAAGRRSVLVATLVVAAQGLAVLAYTAWLGYELVTAEPDNMAVATGSATFLLLFALAVLGVAAALWRRQSWAGGAAIALELLALPICYEMVGGGFWLGALVLGPAAVAALVALMGEPGRTALGR